MNCPECHKPTQVMKLLDDTPRGAVETVHHICPCGWDDFPMCLNPKPTGNHAVDYIIGAKTGSKKAIADFLKERKPKHQPPPKSER